MIPITVTNDEECQLCPIRTLIAPLTAKWRPLILLSLQGGRQRYSDVKRLIGDITQRVLTQNLRNLERDGYLTREVEEGSRRQVYYELTDRGHAALNSLIPLIDWAADNLQEVKDSRADYDARDPD